jgi:hypothetical protein
MALLGGARIEATRLARLRRPARSTPVLEDSRAAVAVLPAFGPESLERLVLVTHTFGRDRAPALLEGLCAREASSAYGLLEALAARGSAERQGRIAQVFGPVAEAPVRLRHLMAEASPALKAEVLRRLPPYYRSLFPLEAAPRPATAPPALVALAERLVREATR